MQQVAAWLQGVLLRPRATAVLIACLTGLALVTSGWAYMVNGSPTSAIPGSGSSSTQTADVTVTLYDNRIESSQMTFTPSVRYHVTAVNKGTINHELMLMPQVMGPGMASMPMEQLDHMALARTGDMAPSATKTFDYTFPSAMTGRQLEFGCYYPGHYASGMHMPITINK
jgi:uncharacterized cupredoxin-like copper-binding protein